MKSGKDTYKRLMRKIIRDLSRLQPGSDPLLAEKLNKKLKKYSEKLK